MPIYLIWKLIMFISTDLSFRNIVTPLVGDPNYSSEGYSPITFEACNLSHSVLDKCDLSDVEINNCNISGLKINGILIEELMKNAKNG